jgi:hypothetical protein
MPIAAVLVAFMVAVVTANRVLMPRLLVLIPAVSMPAVLVAAFLEPVVVESMLRSLLALSYYLPL